MGDSPPALANTSEVRQLIAFRNVVRNIPIKTCTDEAHIEFKIKENGLELRYVPEAILYNKGPETINEYLNQRRRNYAGHLPLKKNTGYSVSSMDLSNLIMAVRNINFTPKGTIFCVGAGILEVIGRILGSYDIHIKKTNHYIWDVVKTTKDIEE